MTALFALGLLIAIAGAIKAALAFLTGYDAREWEIHKPLFPVRTVNGEKVSADFVMRRKIDGKREYRKCTDAELKQAVEDEETGMPLV